MKWVEFEGDTYSVAKQLGYFWGSYVQAACFQEKWWCKGLAPRNDLSAWDRRLLRQFLPGIETELNGITAGVNEAGIKASRAGIFAKVLGEADYGCATIAKRMDHGSYWMCHNEEWDVDVPLCFAKVRVKTASKSHCFLSVSYPFQLFGSACGATLGFGFSGNSIELRPSLKGAVRKGKYGRIPKTFLTRALLDQTSFHSAGELLETFTYLQANNLCFVSPSGLWRARIVPSRTVKARKASQIFWHQSVDFFVQTNHLPKGDCGETVRPRSSVRREAEIRSSLMGVDSLAELESVMTRPNGVGRISEETIATISFSFGDGTVKSDAIHYFTGRQIRMKPVVLE